MHPTRKVFRRKRRLEDCDLIQELLVGEFIRHADRIRLDDRTRPNEPRFRQRRQGLARTLQVFRPGFYVRPKGNDGPAAFSDVHRLKYIKNDFRYGGGEGSRTPVRNRISQTSTRVACLSSRPKQADRHAQPRPSVRFGTLQRPSGEPCSVVR